MLYVTYCSGKKDPKEGSIPAIERYDSDRIRWVYNLSIKDKADFAILSGVLGLLYPNEKIPYYDHKMNIDDVERIAKLIKWFLRDKNYEKIVYFTENPHGEPVLRYYYKSLKKAIDKSYLFSIFGIDAGVEDELNGNIIPEKVKNIFKKEGFIISIDATVTREEENCWVITDREEFIVRKENGKLNILDIYTTLNEEKEQNIKLDLRMIQKTGYEVID